MSTTYPDRKRMRLANWDYGSQGAYFVTICTFQRRCVFEDPQTADILRTTWNRTAYRGQIAPEYEFVVMPNHVHGILWLPGQRDGRAQATDEQVRPCGARARSAGAILAAFKATSARRINLLHNTPGTPVWQRGYYDRVIRDDRELDAIRQYILDNPAKWDLDHNNPDNQS